MQRRLLWVLFCGMTLGGGAWATRQRLPSPPKTTPTPTNRPAPRADLTNYDKPLTALFKNRRVNARRLALLVEKSHYRLTLKYKGQTVKVYPVVFGLNPISDKRREGDRCTPEGRFAIATKQVSRSWHRFLLLSYPTPDSWRKFRSARQRGEIPANATIGGEVGIHGTPKGYDSLIDSQRNWTWGCISMKNADVEEICAVVRVGTPVTIVP